MKRFYLALPTRYEDQIIETLGGLGTIQLITDYTINGVKRVDTVEKCEKYVKLQQRMSSVLSALPPERVAKKGVAQSLKKSFGKPVRRAIEVPTVTLEDIESDVLEIEKSLDDRLGKLEKLRSELKKLKTLDENLLILQKHGVKANELGEFENIFVKAGFMNRAFSTKLQRYVEGTSVRFAKWPDRREEDFIVILGSKADKPHVEETLTRLNFAELTFGGIAPDSAQALDQIRASMDRAQQDVDGIEKEVRGICEGFQTQAADFDPVVRRALAVEGARMTFSRTETLSVVHGWIPTNQQDSLASTVKASTNGVAFLRFDDPDADDQPPTQLGNAGAGRFFELFTKLRGLPQYHEVDPTPIITVLFTIMYGMMFGDVGQGAVLLGIGLILSRLRRDFLGIPARAMGRLGGVVATCGISAMVFGTLYGEFFLSDAIHPIFASPIQSQTSMIIVALLFGVAQLTLGLVLKIVNLLRIRAMFEAVFGGIRLVYYIIGVALAVQFAKSMSFAVFTENIWLTIAGVGCLIVLFLSPAVEGVLRHEASFGKNIMKGASEFIETFLSYLTNSISYVRLAAFAIAHSALGIAAVILASTMGVVPSFIVMNFLALTIEALGVFIQCMRLTYYEFFTKFYSGNGVPYRPLSLPRILGTVK